MNISIITPVYHGNNYLDKLIKNIESITNTQYINSIELVLVNDSPEIPFNYSPSKKLKITEVINSKNVGIHQSRINGLKESSGEYIIFLDQDDSLTSQSINNYASMIEQYNDFDIVLSNGYIEDNNNQKNLIFKDKHSQRFATSEKPYLLARDFIVSPGQCLIKKTSIPREWTDKGLTNNGTDDFLLWLLMFNDKAKIICNYEAAYIHKHTGNNLSLNNEKMRKSQKEMLSFLERSAYPQKKLKALRSTIDFKNNYKMSPLKYIVKHPIVFIYNIYYRVVWKGYICH